jgi:hypothetical protein
MKPTELEAILRGIAPVLREQNARMKSMQDAMREEIIKAVGGVQLLPGPPGPQGAPGVGGEPGPGVELQTIEAMIETAVAAAWEKMPVPEDGEDGAQGPPGRDGESVTLEDVQKLIADEVGRQLGALFDQQRAASAEYTKELLAGIGREVTRGSA